MSPALPDRFGDEAEVLLADTAFTLHKLDRTINHLAHYDSVSGLPDRTGFFTRRPSSSAEPSTEAATLYANGCHDFQGCCFSPPLPVGISSRR